jgi:hypothetical protein
MLRFLFFIVLSCFISSKEAQACSCARVPMPGTAQDAYFEKQAQQADYIFLATVTDQRAGSEKSKEFWDFKVEKVWKGNVQPVFTYESSQKKPIWFTPPSIRRTIPVTFMISPAVAIRDWLVRRRMLW